MTADLLIMTFFFFSSRFTSHFHDQSLLTGQESQTLLGSGGESHPLPARVAALASAAKMPRNCSQPAMNQGSSGVIPKNGSVPNFERRLSKVEYASTMKVSLFFIVSLLLYVVFKYKIFYYLVHFSYLPIYNEI